MHKTGSTSVQLTLGQVKDPVGWSYLALDGSNMGTAMQAMFGTTEHKYDMYLKRGWAQAKIQAHVASLRERLAERITASRDENIIISGENISRIDRAGVAAIHDFLKPLCDELKVIGYVRPPIGYKVSNFQQRLKLRPQSFNLQKIKLKYRGRFEKFDDIFGRENVLLRKFDPALFTNRCAVHDFCEHVGIPTTAFDSVVRINESMSREACGILYAYRKFGTPNITARNIIKENNRMLAPLLAMGGAKFGIRRDVVVASIKKDEAADIQWMESRLGTTLEEKIVDRGTEIETEADLLKITADSCREYADRYEEIYGIRIPEEIVPKGDLVDPVKVAEFVASCQTLRHEATHRARVATAVRKKEGLSLMQRCLSFFSKNGGRDQSKSRGSKERNLSAISERR